MSAAGEKVVVEEELWDARRAVVRCFLWGSPQPRECDVRRVPHASQTRGSCKRMRVLAKDCVRRAEWHRMWKDAQNDDGVHSPASLGMARISAERLHTPQDLAMGGTFSRRPT